MQTLLLHDNWTFRQLGGSGLHGKAVVPGTVHDDLMAAGAIPDPFVGTNEEALHWIGESDWLYETSFVVPADLRSADRIDLVCEGLDTFAELRLDGRLLGSSDNQFRTYRHDISSALAQRPAEGRHRLAIRFRSVFPEVRRQEARRRLYCPGADRFKIDGGQYVRKSPCNFGWDWGPRCVTHGIWRPIYIQAVDTARLSHVHVRQAHGRGRVTLELRAEAEGVRAAGGRATLEAAFTLTPPAGAQGEPIVVRVPVRRGEARARIDVESPCLWWPNGEGAQPLYGLAVSLFADGRPVDERELRVGLRTVELVRERDRFGTSFAFRVNGRRIFARGANWIPGDVFVPRVPESRLRHLLTSATAVHMNMIRVWGGGVYESEAFYDLCDELGLLVWQDFMFACTGYPAYDEAWRSNVRAEAIEQIRRLHHRACLALWCGNNEIPMMPRVMGDDRRAGQLAWSEYRQVFHDLLPKEVSRHDGATAYWPSSPWTAMGRDVNDDSAGDVHLWDVWWGLAPFDNYRSREPRFVSEFGFQSFPHPRTIASIAAPADRNFSSRVMDHHQRGSTRMGSGNGTMLAYLSDWLRAPSTFESTVFASQVLQGIALKLGVEHWRATAPRCAGTLYWQLNDVWPGASWSTIDYDGRWKAAHYLARSFFQPWLICGIEDRGRRRLAVHVCNDEPEAGRVRWEVTSTALDGARLAAFDGESVVRPGQPRKVIDLPYAELTAGRRDHEVAVWLQLYRDGVRIATNLVVLVPFKHLDLQAPGLIATGRSDGSVRITAKTAPAFWVRVEDDVSTAWSDNFFHLRRGENRVIRRVPVGDSAGAVAGRPPRLTSLHDSL